jgi:predicted transposase/invertase (TIGR01784 family)
MKRDSLFYRLFSQSPELLFELLADRPDNAPQYRFDSVAVKEPKFEIDGVFLPPESEAPGIVYFCEVQMQKDEQLYERLFGESMLYFFRQRARFSDWQAVAIYPSRSAEQTDIHPYRALLNSDQVHRIYLNELGEMAQLPLGVAAMVLTISKESEAPAQARILLSRANQEIAAPIDRQGIIEIGPVALGRRRHGVDNQQRIRSPRTGKNAAESGQSGNRRTDRQARHNRDNQSDHGVQIY